jgi:two-component system chemotaxis response regulator CheB
MAKRDIVVIGASAGGVAALRRLVSLLPADIDASLFVVQHLAPAAGSALPDILSRSGPLPAVSPMEGDRIMKGVIYVAPPDLHLLLQPDRIALRRGPQENRTRPAINALFRSAAVSFGPRVIGVLLTGMLDDGTSGLNAIKAAGGVSVVQDPEDAEWPSMPKMALEGDHVDYCLPLDDIPALLISLIASDAGPDRQLSQVIRDEAAISEIELANTAHLIDTPGRTSSLSCPQCGGVLNEIKGEGDMRFRCQIGHAFSAETLAAAQDNELERALLIAVRTHRDRMQLYDAMYHEAMLQKRPYSAQRWHKAANEASQMVNVLEKAMAKLASAKVGAEGVS